MPTGNRSNPPKQTYRHLKLQITSAFGTLFPSTCARASAHSIHRVLSTPLLDPGWIRRWISEEKTRGAQQPREQSNSHTTQQSKVTTVGEGEESQSFKSVLPRMRKNLTAETHPGDEYDIDNIIHCVALELRSCRYWISS